MLAHLAHELLPARLFIARPRGLDGEVRSVKDVGPLLELLVVGLPLLRALLRELRAEARHERLPLPKQSPREKEGPLPRDTRALQRDDRDRQEFRLRRFEEIVDLVG